MVKVTLLPLSGKNLDSTEPKMAFPLLSVATISCCTPPFNSSSRTISRPSRPLSSVPTKPNTCAAKTPFG